MSSMDSRLYIVRGSRAFAAACLAASVSASVMVVSKKPPIDNDSEPLVVSEQRMEAKSHADLSSPAPMMTASLLAANAKIAPIEGVAVEPSDAQKRVLAHARYAPIKTVIYERGKRQVHLTLHPFDMLRLAREASDWAKLSLGVKLDPAKIAAVALTESSGVARVGWSSNGKTPSFGLAQLEAETAKGLGITDAEDPAQSMRAIAHLLALGAKFAKKYPQVDPEIAQSLHYNTGTRLRNELAARGENLTMGDLPLPTQAHVKNMAHNTATFAQFERLYRQHAKQACTFNAPPKPSQPSQTKDYSMSSHAPSTSPIVFSGIAQLDAARRAANQQPHLTRTDPAISLHTRAGVNALNSRLGAMQAIAAAELAEFDKAFDSMSGEGRRFFAQPDVNKLTAAFEPYVSTNLQPNSGAATLAEMVAAVKIQAGHGLSDVSAMIQQARMNHTAHDAPRG